MCRLVGQWLDELPCENKILLAKEKNDAADDPDDNLWFTADELVFSSLRSMIMDRYDPQKVLNVLSDSVAEPMWLTTMLQDSKWRLTLIQLAEKHQVCIADDSLSIYSLHNNRLTLCCLFYI